ncbi:BA75_02376T0 [Komagataella pastoris]|uniref:BA75_02376T0 n=1 Tax=Komagataella pastoris TaxID=4922 RepID=A0A1B2JB04_PICPA|nr:BA75_02376T0 [Komagataella pastoris]
MFTGAFFLLFLLTRIRCSHSTKARKSFSIVNRISRVPVIIVVFLLLLLTWTYLKGHGMRNTSSKGIINSTILQDMDQYRKLFEVDTQNIDKTEFYDLNLFEGTSKGVMNEEVILMLIPLRNAEDVLPFMFLNMMNMTYPHSLVDVAFLVSDCTSGDSTLETVSDFSYLLQNGTLLTHLQDLEGKYPGCTLPSSFLFKNFMKPGYGESLLKAYSPPYHSEFEKPFRTVQIFQKDFGQAVGQGFNDRHDVKVQGIRRKLMGRARNWLLSTSLKPYHSWVYWRDADIESSPGSVIQDLMKFRDQGFDVIIPNVWRPLPEFLGNEQPYDLNAWIESDAAKELASSLDEDDVIVEGYAEYPTWRVHLAYLRSNEGNPNDIIDLDGVGGVSILARAELFRKGAHFSAFTFENHAETEAFGKMAKKMGFRVGGTPHYTLWHIYEPSVDDLKQMKHYKASENSKQ